MARLSDIFAEINATQLWQERSRQADAAAASFNPGQVREMSLVTRMYPDIRPGALLALAHNQYRADHPLVQQVGELSAALALREAPAGIQIGQPGATVGMRRALSNARRDAARAANQPRHVPPPTNPALREIWEQANVAGLVEGGLFQDPGGDLDSPQQFMYRQVRDAYLEANEPMPTITEEGRPVLLTRGSPLTSGEGWAVKVEPLVEEEPSDRGPGVGPGGINLGVQRAGIAGIEAINAGARAAFMALDAPVQEIQGQVRNLYAATQGRNPDWLESQSDLGVYIGDPDLDAGSGLFVDPESALANERRRREAERGQIGGHNVTAGRWLANTAGLDPDTRPFQLMSGMTDLGVQIADPSGWGLGQAGKAGQARRLFTAGGDAESAAGLIRGLRNVVRPVDAQRWLDSDIGIQSVQRLTETTSPADVWRALNYKVDLDTATRIADTRSVADTRAVVEPMLGTSIREVSTATVGQGRAQFDPRTVMPQRGQIDAWDKNQVAFEVESFLRNAGAEADYAAPYIDKIARADTPVQVNAAIRESLRGTDGLLVQAGVEDEALRGTLTRLHADTHETVQASVRAAMTNQGPSTAPLMVNGEAVDVLDPVLVSELAPRFLSLPDARAIRRATSDMPNLFKGALWRKKDFQPRVGWAVVEHLQNDLWKPLQLMRAAWTVRVVGEEQLRMAAAGYDSMFNHPLSFISHRMGRKGNTDIQGELLEEADQFTNAMSRTHGQWIDTARIPTNLKTTFTKNVHENDRYIPAWGSELLLLHGDPVARRVATSASLDEAVEWFTRGGGNEFRADFAVAYPGKFDSPQQARRYIEGVQNRIHYATGGDSSLLDAVATGKLDGENLLAGTGLNKKIRPTLESKLDFAPETVLGSESLAVDRGVRGQVSDAKDRAVEILFGVLMTNRTNNLSRSPTFKQAYWREAARLIGFTDEATKATIIGQAREANLGSRAIKRMERVKPRGQATLGEIDLLAKGHGLDETRNLLYDLSQRGRFMDAARVVFPFGEAWKEVLTRWLGRDGLIANNPAVVRRFQQVVRGARGEEFGDFMGAPDGEGFFWKNEFDEEVFLYPGSGLLTEKLLGVEIPLSGSVQGMSMFGTVVPGLGPAVQIPTAWLLKTKPGPQFVREAFSAIETARLPEGIPVVGGTTAREQILPFGSPSESDMGEAANVLNYLPTWMRTTANFLTSGDGNERQWGNAVNSVAAYLATTGDYGTSPGERQRLMEDAAFKARWFMLIKGVAQSTAPSSPSEDWRLVDRNDRSVRVRALAEEYRQLQEDNYGEADRTFLDRYGVDVLAAIQSDTVGTEYGLPTTREGVAWVIANPGVTEDLPHTYGFFAPQGGEFDYSLYAEQFQTGQRHQMSADEWTRLMNSVKGDLQYDAAKLEVGEDAETDDGEAYLREVREWIATTYDGWGDRTGIPQKPETDTLIRELSRALNNDAVRETDAGRGLALYLEGRDEVLADAESRGVTLGANEMQGGREYLTELGAWVVGEHPGFSDMFAIIFSRELED